MTSPTCWSIFIVQIHVGRGWYHLTTCPCGQSSGGDPSKHSSSFFDPPPLFTPEFKRLQTLCAQWTLTILITSLSQTNADIFWCGRNYYRLTENCSLFSRPFQSKVCLMWNSIPNCLLCPSLCLSGGVHNNQLVVVGVQLYTVHSSVPIDLFRSSFLLLPIMCQ